MNTMDTTDMFLTKLKEDSLDYKDLNTSEYNLAEKKQAIRSLMNIRMPKELPGELTALQDRYLQDGLAAKGAVTLSDIPTIKKAWNSRHPYADKISLWQGDITRLAVDAIVNAANPQLLGCFAPCHGCIDNAVHSAAGMQLRQECSHIMNRRRFKYGRNYEEPAGTATLTPGYNLPCRSVIHTVGPIVHGRLNDRHCQKLQACYESVLNCCLEHQIQSVAFCCISTGEYHFPNDRAANIALQTVTSFLETHGGRIERIIFNVFKDIDLALYQKALQA